MYATVTLELWAEALLLIYFSAISFINVVKLFACISCLQIRTFCCWKTKKQLQALHHCADAEILMGHEHFVEKELEVLFVLTEFSFKNKKKKCDFLLLVFLYTLPCAPLKFSQASWDYFSASMRGLCTFNRKKRNRKKQK